MARARRLLQRFVGEERCAVGDTCGITKDVRQKASCLQEEQ